MGLRTWTSGINRSEIIQDSSLAMEKMVRELSLAGSITTARGDEITFLADLDDKSHVILLFDRGNFCTGVCIGEYLNHSDNVDFSYCCCSCGCHGRRYLTKDEKLEVLRHKKECMEKELQGINEAMNSIKQ